MVKSIHCADDFPMFNLRKIESIALISARMIVCGEWIAYCEPKIYCMPGVFLYSYKQVENMAART